MQYRSQENRRFVRLPAELPVQWRVDNSHEGRGIIRDVSRDGFGLELDRSMNVAGVVLKLRFETVERGGRPVEVRAQLVWFWRIDASDRYRGGCRITPYDWSQVRPVSEVFYTALHAGTIYKNLRAGRFDATTGVTA